MAADLNQRMQGLGMNESVHAEAAPSSGASNHSSGSGEQKRAAYIPPHMRNAHRAPAAAPPSGPTAVQNGAANGVQGSRWSAEYVFTFLIRYFLFATLGHCILSHRDFSCNETNIQNCSVVICPLKKNGFLALDSLIIVMLSVIIQSRICFAKNIVRNYIC